MKKVQGVIGVIGGVIGYFIGEIDGMVVALLVFVTLDYVTGVMRAVYEKRVSSEVGFKGICRKVLIFMLVGVGNIIDVYVIKSGCVIRSAVICFYLSNEGISILENAAGMGVKIPERLKSVLIQLRDKDSENSSAHSENGSEHQQSRE